MSQETGKEKKLREEEMTRRAKKEESLMKISGKKGRRNRREKS